MARLREAWSEQAGWVSAPETTGLDGLPGVIPGADETTIGDTFGAIAGWFLDNLAGVTVA